MVRRCGLGPHATERGRRSCGATGATAHHDEVVSNAFGTLVVPITFETAESNELALDRAIEIRQQHWVVASESTIAALRLAAKLASGGTLHLVHATLDLRATAALHGTEGVLMPPTNVEQLHAASAQHSSQVMKLLAQRHCGGVELVYHAKPGRPVDVILHHARSCAADGIVLAASGRNRVQRLLIGSTVDKIVRQSTCPVIVVPS